MPVGALATASVVATQLNELADKPGLGSRRDELKSLADALQGLGDGDIEPWTELDLLQAYARPESVSAALADAPEHRAWALLEVAIGTLVFLPLLLTWFGLSRAADAYRTLIGEDPKSAARPFLQLWQSGFEGRLADWSTFGHVAGSATAVILLLFLRAAVHGVRRTRTEHRADQARRTADELLALLVPLLTRAQLLLNEQRLSSPTVHGGAHRSRREPRQTRGERDARPRAARRGRDLARRVGRGRRHPARRPRLRRAPAGTGRRPGRGGRTDEHRRGRPGRRRAHRPAGTAHLPPGDRGQRQRDHGAQGAGGRARGQRRGPRRPRRRRRTGRGLGDRPGCRAALVHHRNRTRRRRHGPGPAPPRRRHAGHRGGRGPLTAGGAGAGGADRRAAAGRRAVRRTRPGDGRGGGRLRRAAEARTLVDTRFVHDARPAPLPLPSGRGPSGWTWPRSTTLTRTRRTIRSGRPDDEEAAAPRSPR